jgi:type VI secretion system secreted protein VgrG
MPVTTPRTQANRPAAAFTPLGEDILLLKRFSANEQLGRLFEYELDLITDQPEKVDANKLLGAPVAVRVDLADGSPRYFHGLCSRFSQISGDGDVNTYRATVVPWLWTLTRTADCRIFHDDARQSLTVPKIVLQVFRDFGASAFRDALAGSYDKLEYCVQYCETAFAFVSRLMEREGIYYFFEHKEDGHKLVLADASTAHEPFPGYETLVYRGRDRAHPSEEHVSRWEVRHEIQPGAVALNSFDFKKPGDDLKVKKTVSRQHDNAAFEWYDFQTFYDKRDIGEQYAKARLDEFHSDYEVITGEATTPGLAVGHTFKVSGLPSGSEETEYLVTSMRTLVVPDAYESTSKAANEPLFRCQFTAIPAKQNFRPARVTPLPRIRGPQTAVVVGPSGEEIHTDEFGRIRVQFPWDRRGKGDETSSCWIRVSQNWAGKKWGAMFLPRVGQEVIVEYLEGDPDRPIVTGKVYNGDHNPPYGLPDQATKSTIKSLSSKGGGGFNEIRFEDKKGEEQIFIHGEKQLDIRIEKDAYEYIGKDRHMIVKGDQVEKVEGARSESVGGDHKEQVDKDRHVKVTGKEAIEIGGSHSLTVTGDVIEVFKGNHSEQTTQNLYVKAMGVVIEAQSGITLKCGGNSVVIDPSGVTVKGTMVVLDGSMTRINSGPGSPAMSGSPGSAVAPAAPADPHEADKADPGEMEKVKAKQVEEKKGKYGAVPVTPHKPPQTQEEKEKKPSWVAIELRDVDGQPIAGEPYRIELPDGSVQEGTLDDKGFAQVDGIEPGSCKITFPNRDARAWNAG